MSSDSHDTSKRGGGRARIAPTQPGDGWIRPSHGKGLLKPWQPGNKLGGQRPGRYQETQQLARDHSLQAIKTLVQRLDDADGRIAVMSASILLERAWGKVRAEARGTRAGDDRP